VKQKKSDPVADVAAFFERSSVLMSAQDIARRTGHSVDETNRALQTLQRRGYARIDHDVNLWTNLSLKKPNNQQLAATTA